MIRILHVIDKLGIRGATVHGATKAVLQWIEYADKTEFAFAVCSLRAPEPAGDLFAQADIPLTFLSRSKVDPRTILDLHRLIRRWRPDVLHLHGYGAANFGRVAGLLNGIPRIVHEHAILTGQPVHQTVADCILAPLTTRAVAVSDAVRDFMVERRHVRADLIETIANGVPVAEVARVDRDAVAAVRAEIGLDSAERVVCAVGRLDPIKRFTDLVAAAPSVLERVPNVRFIIVGDGPEAEPLREQIAGLGVEERFTLPGYRSDVSSFLSIADVIAMPSLSEGSPLVLFEAMSLGKPVVATPAILTVDMLQMETGIGVPVRDPQRLAEAILEILQDDERARLLSANARERANDFDISVSVERLAQLYRHVTGHRAGLDQDGAPGMVGTEEGNALLHGRRHRRSA